MHHKGLESRRIIELAFKELYQTPFRVWISVRAFKHLILFQPFQIHTLRGGKRSWRVWKKQNFKNILLLYDFNNCFWIVNNMTIWPSFFIEFLTSFSIFCHPCKPWVCFHGMHLVWLRFETRLKQLSPPFILPPKTFLNYLRSIPLDLNPK